LLHEDYVMIEETAADIVDTLIHVLKGVPFPKRETAPQENELKNKPNKEAQTEASVPKEQYYISLNGTNSGPFELEAMKKKIKSGEVKRETSVWKEGMKEWAAASAVKELSCFLPPSAPPPAAPEVKLEKDNSINITLQRQSAQPISGTTAQPPKPSAPQTSSSSTSMPSASPALLKQYSNYKYVLGMYDWIDNLNGTWKGNRGKGYLIIAMEKTDGNPDIKNAKFIFDGFSEGMLVRNNMQVVYMPVMDNYIKNILLRVKEVFIAEMDNKNNIKEYTVKIDVINNSLPIPVPEKNRMKAQLK